MLILIINILQRIPWSSSDKDRELCLIKGKGEDDCQNYIRVLARVDPRTILVCGTNSFNPLCRHYTYSTQMDATQFRSSSAAGDMLPMIPGTTPQHCIQVCSL